MSGASTLFDRLWSSHEVVRREDGASLLWVDRHLVHEGSHHAFGKLAERDLPVSRPDLTIAVSDHYAPTRNRGEGGATETIRRMITTLDENAKSHNIRHFGLHDPRQGIVHVTGPEQGLTLPGLMIVCGDSHTSTHGAFGALAFGIGATEVAHVLAKQTVWQVKPKQMRISFSGTLPLGVTAKDMALHWIAELGSDGARSHAVEYAGTAVKALTMEERMTLCNLSIEGGASAAWLRLTKQHLAMSKAGPSRRLGMIGSLRSRHGARLEATETLPLIVRLRSMRRASPPPLPGAWCLSMRAQSVVGCRITHPETRSTIWALKPVSPLKA